MSAKKTSINDLNSTSKDDKEQIEALVNTFLAEETICIKMSDYMLF